MTNAELSSKLVARVEYMIMQFMPKPTCSNKKAEWQKNVNEIKRSVAERLSPSNNGIKITV